MLHTKTSWSIKAPGQGSGTDIGPRTVPNKVAQSALSVFGCQYSIKCVCVYGGGETKNIFLYLIFKILNTETHRELGNLQGH